MLSLPWSCVTQLRLEPVGPIRPEVFGLQYVGMEFEKVWTRDNQPFDLTRDPNDAWYAIVDRDRLRMTRDALGGLVDSPTGLRRPDKTPFYTLLCEVHRALQEEQ